MAHRGPADDSATVSVILPNYNHGHFLERPIEALLSQDRRPAEILLIDDGSTDDSIGVIERLARDAPLIRVLRNPHNLGVIATQQRGLAEAKGRYVYFAAADDWIMPGFFQLAVEMLERHPQAGLFAGDAALLDGVTGRSLGIRPIVAPCFQAGFVDPSHMRKLLVAGDHQIVTGAALFRRDAIAAAGGLDPDLGSFADGFLARKIALTRGFCYAPRVVSTWRIFPTGMSRQSSMDLDNARRMLDVARRKLASDPAFPHWYADRFDNRWRFATSRLVLKEPAVDFDFVLAMAARNALDRAVLKTVWAVSTGALGRTAALFWLWLRLRPYRLRDLLSTMIFRKLSSRRSPAQSAQGGPSALPT